MERRIAGLTDAREAADPRDDVKLDELELRAYLLRERLNLNLYELACLLHGASPERVQRRAWDDMREHDSDVSGRHESPAPDLVAGMIDACPEMILGDSIGGTLKRLRIATGLGTFAAVTIDTAARLADGLGLALPSDMRQVVPDAELAADRRRRRLERFHQLGGLLRQAGSTWHTSGGETRRSGEARARGKGRWARHARQD